MKRRIVGALLLAGTLSGCVNMDGSPDTGGVRANFGRSSGPPSVPGVRGPYGENVPMIAPYDNAPPGSQAAAMRMLNANQPMNRIQMNSPGMPMSGAPGMPPTMVPPMGTISPPNMPFMPGAPPGGPFQKTSAVGMGGDPSVMNAFLPPGAKMPGDMAQAQFANSSPVGSLFPAQRTQVFFPKPAGMKIYWFTQGADGKPNYSTTPLETPGRYNFAQGAIYRLKLTHIPGRPALELYPTLEVVPTSPRTNEFLAHNSVPVEFSEDDFKQVVDRNYIVKVIYLPDPQFQDAGGAGPDEIVSTRLEPGQDPIQEALRRGSILMVLRIGNIDQGLIHSPPTTAPIPGGAPPTAKPPGMGVAPFMQVPFPLTPITPGGAPNQLPPLPSGNPPLINLPKLPMQPGGKVEDVGAPKNEGSKLTIPPIELPAPPGLKKIENANPAAPNGDKPLVPPIPNPVEKNDKGIGANPALPALPSPPIIPASSSKQTETPLPGLSSTPPVTLPAIDMPLPPRGELPVLPAIPAPKQ